MFRLICFIFGYLIGCIQTAYYVGKIMNNIDIREYGSGNAGSTNITRVLGLKAGLITFASDVFKAFLVCVLCAVIFKGQSTFYTYAGDNANGLLPSVYGGLGLIIGHNYPFQLKFKGGKGIASTLGIFLCLNWQIALISYCAGFLIVFTTRYVSAASLAICLLFTVLFVLSKPLAEAAAIVVILTATAYYRHRANIKRLLNGTESKFSVGGAK